MNDNKVKELLRNITWALIRFKPINILVRKLKIELDNVNRMDLEHKVRSHIATNNQVVSGIFQGMKFPYMDFRGYLGITPLLLGTYELEIHEELNSLLKNNKYSEVVNIGAAEGYYSVGIALKQPSARIISFEVVPFLLEKCRQLSEANNVSERFEYHGWCDVNSMSKIEISKRGLVFCDCEGGEFDILDPKLCPNLLKCDIVVEFHDLFKNEISKTIIERFESTHEIIILDQRVRNEREFSFLKGLSLSEKFDAIFEERRGFQQWGILKLKEQENH